MKAIYKLGTHPFSITKPWILGNVMRRRGLFSSQFWRLKVQDPAAPRFSFWQGPPGRWCQGCRQEGPSGKQGAKTQGSGLFFCSNSLNSGTSLHPMKTALIPLGAVPTVTSPSPTRLFFLKTLPSQYHQAPSTSTLGGPSPSRP